MQDKITISLPKEMLDKISERASNEYRSRQSVIRQIVGAGLQNG